MRRHIAGYALLSYDDLMPLQFGLVDARKTMEVQQKALEIAAALRDLRQAAPQKLQRSAGGDLPDRDPDARWRWLIAVDDCSADRAPPRYAKDSQAQRATSMLQGLVLSDCRRLFKIAPVLTHPRLARQHLGVRGTGQGAREEILQVATSEVPDFPEVRHRSGALNEDTLLMSDAWATALCAHRQELVAERRGDAMLVEKFRRQVLRIKHIQRMHEAVEELHPRKASLELAAVLETRVEKYIEDRIHRLIDAEDDRRREDRQRAEEEAAAASAASVASAADEDDDELYS